MASVNPKEDYSFPDLSNSKIGILVAEWHPEVTDKLLEGANKVLKQCNIPEDKIIIKSVPGAYELPVAATLLDGRHNPDALICLGCVIKGETNHDEYINQAVAKSLIELSLFRKKPFTFGVITALTLDQAKERAGGTHGNKGQEAAMAAIKMIQFKNDLNQRSTSIGFKT